ncbi:MAG TPA: hypothetical protein VFV38_44640, partial [Ktedonobacteraceae bacterium]|nr:hypothetical protein [Ktedonobacteraceae bacterium]
YTLAMGDVAVRLAHYEQAMFHYTQCITFLDERRMNNANLRVRALLGLGLTHLLTGYSVSALNYYTEALRVSGKDSCSEYLPDIYYGLCEISRHQPHDERALDYGKKALQLYIERGNKGLECQMRNILGRIYSQMGDFEASNACYTESLALAMNVGSETMTLNNYIALADLCLAKGKSEEAWRYCALALDYRTKMPHPLSVGRMYLTCGKVAEALAKGAESQERMKQAIAYYKQAAEQLQNAGTSSDLLAEAYSRLAQVQEAAGYLHLALASWHSACNALRSYEHEIPLFQQRSAFQLSQR